VPFPEAQFYCGGPTTAVVVAILLLALYSSSVSDAEQHIATLYERAPPLVFEQGTRTFRRRTPSKADRISFDVYVPESFLPFHKNRAGPRY